MSAIPAQAWRIALLVVLAGVAVTALFLLVAAAEGEDEGWDEPWDDEGERREE